MNLSNYDPIVLLLGNFTSCRDWILEKGQDETKKGRFILRAMLARNSEREYASDGYFLLQRPMTLPCGSPMVPQ